MISNFFLSILTLMLGAVSWAGSETSFLLNGGIILGNFDAAVGWLLSSSYYFQGLFPVTDFLNFIGYVLGWYSTLFLWNVTMYLWSKVPFISVRTANE